MTYDLITKFIQLINAGKLSQAYLFFGSGSNSFAPALANFLERKVFELPAAILTELLVIEKDEKGIIGIDSVKPLKQFLYQKPIASKYRTCIVKEAENLTTEAQNAVLKIVEEPPSQSLIIFIANNEDNLLPTLVSRLQKIYFPQKATKKIRIKINDFRIDEIIDNEPLEQFFESLIDAYKKDPVKNFKQLKEILKRLTLIKQFNTNRRLQLRVLKGLVKNFEL
jgi:hypothetical protein